MIKFITAAELLSRRDTSPPPTVLDISAATVTLAGTHRVLFDDIVRNDGATVGLLPPIEQLNQALRHTGITPDRVIVLLDDQQGLAASRLAWTLAVCGFTRLLMIDGGRAAIEAAGWPVGEAAAAKPTPPLIYDLRAHYCTAEVIRDHLSHPDWQLIDARSREEFDGTDRRSKQAGHIPGAIHFDWRQFFQETDPNRLRPDAEILSVLAERGITPQPPRTLAVYCQSHRRSSLVFAVLKHLGFDDVRGYPGAWSDWGNRDDLPIETLRNL